MYTCMQHKHKPTHAGWYRLTVYVLAYTDLLMKSRNQVHAVHVHTDLHMRAHRHKHIQTPIDLHIIGTHIDLHMHAHARAIHAQTGLQVRAHTHTCMHKCLHTHPQIVWRFHTECNVTVWLGVILPI